ncbi:MAG: hypothetical protein GEU78_12435 [Actinobacteria bacterium]|nr:hypothetical protein [Actinomycetota bacterium]
MFDNLLAPMGVPEVPGTIEEAVDRYVVARDAFERRAGVGVPRDMERQARAALRRAGFDQEG